MNYKEEFKKGKTLEQVLDMALREAHDAVIKERKAYLLERQAEKAKKEKEIANQRDNLVEAIIDYFTSLGLNLKDFKDIDKVTEELDKVLMKDEQKLKCYFETLRNTTVR